MLATDVDHALEHGSECVDERDGADEATTYCLKYSHIEIMCLSPVGRNTVLQLLICSTRQLQVVVRSFEH